MHRRCEIGLSMYNRVGDAPRLAGNGGTRRSRVDRAASSAAGPMRMKTLISARWLWSRGGPQKRRGRAPARVGTLTRSPRRHPSACRLGSRGRIFRNRKRSSAPMWHWIHRELGGTAGPSQDGDACLGTLLGHRQIASSGPRRTAYRATTRRAHCRLSSSRRPSRVGTCSPRRFAAVTGRRGRCAPSTSWSWRGTPSREATCSGIISRARIPSPRSLRSTSSTFGRGATCTAGACNRMYRAPSRVTMLLTLRLAARFDMFRMGAGALRQACGFSRCPSSTNSTFRKTSSTLRVTLPTPMACS
mmetsp:Transcript_58007/g.161874  ORF Transcript_58007/g.161874 Transcript_58007/m.161874 type:complete len:302 (-) Transcript_58007:1314-2219(-)